jgi:hypothetical protein
MATGQKGCHLPCEMLNLTARAGNRAQMLLPLLISYLHLVSELSVLVHVAFCDESSISHDPKMKENFVSPFAWLHK